MQHNTFFLNSLRCDGIVNDGRHFDGTKVLGTCTIDNRSTVSTSMDTVRNDEGEKNEETRMKQKFDSSTPHTFPHKSKYSR